VAFDRQIATAVPTEAPAKLPRRRLFVGGTDGNERLTSATGAVLILLLAVIGVTILRLGPLLWVHLFVGMLLVGPVALKLASTGYRFVRYYTSNPRYRRKGPPPLPLRLIAPVIVLTTVVVFASGIALLFAGPGSRETLLPIHKISFIVWVAFTSLHVLAHLPTVLRALDADFAPVVSLPGRHADAALAGRGGRVLSLASALTFGAVLAVVVIPQFGPWLSARHFHH
jgi:hypothetical protein